MPLFTYKAQDEKGNIFEDVIQSGNKEDAVTNIRSQGLKILTIKNPEKRFSTILGAHISTSEKAAFCRFIATMLRSGLSLPESVDIIKQETKNDKMREILTDISYQTQKGKTMSAVLSNYKEEFDEIFITMVKAGEESGTLDQSFDYLSKQLTISHELTEQIKGSLMYPAVIVVAMVGNMLMMAIFVLPRISSVFLKLKLPLPAYTKILLSSGEFFGNNSLLVILGTVLIMGLAFATIVIRRTRSIIIHFLSKLPVVNKVVLYIDIARFSRTFSTLLKSGVPIIDALNVSADSLSQPKLKKEAKKFGEGVAKGENLSDILIRSRGVFPGIMIQTVRAGEQSGSLEKVLEELAVFYEQEVEFSLKRLTSLIEPVLMLVIGVVVGVMVILMIAPIYSLIGGLQESILQP